MKTLSAALQSHIAQHRSRLASCIQITRQDGNVYGFTTHDKVLTIGGVVYEPAVSYKPTDIASANNLDTDNLTVEALIDSDTLTEDDLRAGRWDYADFRVFQVNWSDLTMGDKKDRAGHFGQCTVNRLSFMAELLGLMEAYTISIGEITSPNCRANLGDERCKVDLVGGSPSLTVTGTISYDAGDFFVIRDSSQVGVDGYFAEGVITFTGPPGHAAVGLSYELKIYYAGGTMVMKTPIAYNVLGATYSMHAGCDKQRTTCRDRFSNVINFRGEPWLRGTDAAVQVGRHG